jgi:putative thiamine transport system substrate-binding protein
MAQLVFLYDRTLVALHPRNMQELLGFAKKNPGRFTYPLPPNFHGTTFLKQALLELAGDKAQLYQPAGDADFKQVTEPLWSFLDELHPYLWRRGTAFPANASEMKRLLGDGEIFISLSFNPAEASNAIATGELPDSIRTYVHENGTIGNSHFVAIPFNAAAREGALVFANFLLSPEAQAHKSDPAIWGDPTVLAMNKLSPKDKQRFLEIQQGVATLSAEELGQVLLEPHPSWVDALEEAWLARYSR